jgi:hypothetical protein
MALLPVRNDCAGGIFQVLKRITEVGVQFRGFHQLSACLVPILVRPLNGFGKFGMLGVTLIKATAEPCDPLAFQTCNRIVQA